MKAVNITIGQGQAREAVALLARIPEFTDLYPLAEFERRLQGAAHLILLAWAGTTPIGCKVGYALEPECFYSWMGGVLPEWRRSGAARLLAEAQEDWAQQRGYTRIRFKTRNSCRAMLQFALKRGFYITGVVPQPILADYRIWLEKPLA